MLFMACEQYGVVVFEHGGEHYYHNLDAGKYDSFMRIMDEKKMKFVAGRNNIKERDMFYVMKKVRGLVLRLSAGLDGCLDKELKDF